MIDDPTSTTGPSNRRQATIDAAVDLFAQRGFDGVSVGDLTAAVGVTSRALYRHFPNKQAVLAAVLHQTVDEMVGVLSAAFDAQADELRSPQELLRDCVAAAVRWGLDHPGLFATYMRERDRIEDAALQAQEGRVYDLWARGVQQVAPQLDPVHIALRQKAVLAALSDLTRQPTRIPRPRLDYLLTDALARVSTCPATTADETVSPSPTWRPGPNRRDQIVTAALALWRRPGFHGAGVDEIAQTVGLAGSGLYRYYNDKTEILLDGCERAAARVEIATELALSAATNEADAVRRIVHAYANAALSETDLIVVTAREEQVIPEPQRVHLARRHRRTSELWTTALRQWKPDLSEPEARVLIAAAIPLINHMAMAGRLIPVPEDEAANLALALFDTPAHGEPVDSMPR